jgi:hypothetical protein
MHCTCKNTITTRNVAQCCNSCKSAYNAHLKQRTNAARNKRTQAQYTASLYSSIKRVNAEINYLKTQHARLLQKSNYCSAAFAQRASINAELVQAQIKLAALQTRAQHT